MSVELNRAIVLWTGGKDSALALQKSLKMGMEVVALVTFIPEDEAEFKAHPRAEMRTQAKHLGLPIFFSKVGEPYIQSYVAALSALKQELNVVSVITDDIHEVDGQPNWIAECCRLANLQSHFPLWREDRMLLMSEILKSEFKVRISWINHPKFPASWLNRTLDEDLVKQMAELCSIEGLDLCGENGEYHTMVYWD